MFNRIASLILCLSFLFSASLASAQARGAKSSTSSVQGPRKHLSTIMFSGLAGAVLGLSTLSFYGRPQDKLSNIAVGAAIGIIGGTIISTYKAATEPREFYNLNEPQIPELWRLADTDRFSPPTYEALLPRATWTFSF